MASKLIRALWILLIATDILCSALEIITGPRHSAGMIGEDGQLTCIASEVTNQLEWREFTEGGTGTRIFISQDPDDVEAGYIVDGDPPAYNLTLNPITENKAGLYSCRMVIEDEHVNAEFVALDDFSCSTSAPDTAVEEGTTVIFRCDVMHYGSDVHPTPVLEWFANGNILTTEVEVDEENPNHLSVITNITASSQHDDLEHECRLRFDGNDAPEYTTECSSSIRVLFGASGVMVYPEPENENDVLQMSVGSEINCTARGNPEPVLHWHAEEGESEIIEGGILVMKEDYVEDPKVRTYSCRASNSILGNPRTANRTVKFFVTAGDEEPSTAGVEGWVIGVAVAIPLLAVVGAAVLIYFFFFRMQPWVIALIVLMPIVVIVLAVLANIAVRLKRSSEPPPSYPGDKTDNIDGGGVYPDDSIKQPYPENGKPSPYGNVPQGGVNVLPPGTFTEQHTRTGRDSPGYADLGIRHFGGSNPGLDESVDMAPNPYAQPTRRPPTAPSGQVNRMYDPSPPIERSNQPNMMTGGGSVV